MSGNWTALLLALHVLIGLAIIGLVLLQQGKGADMGSGFGAGSSGSLFGATGSANFLSRTTAVLATVFFITSLGLGYLGQRVSDGAGVMDAVKEVPEIPRPGEAAKSVPAEGKGDGRSGDPPASKAREVPN